MNNPEKVAALTEAAARAFEAAGVKVEHGHRVGTVGGVPNVPGNPANDDDVVILYRNHRGEIAQRFIRPLLMWLGESVWHGRGYHLDAWDHERGSTRTFFLAGILAWGRPAVEAYLNLSNPPCLPAAESKPIG